jgi:hypothetical protein
MPHCDDPREITFLYIVTKYFLCESTSCRWAVVQQLEMVSQLFAPCVYQWWHHHPSRTALLRFVRISSFIIVQQWVNFYFIVSSWTKGSDDGNHGIHSTATTAITIVIRMTVTNTTTGGGGGGGVEIMVW